MSAHDLQHFHDLVRIIAYNDFAIRVRTPRTLAEFDEHVHRCVDERLRFDADEIAQMFDIYTTESARLVTDLDAVTERDRRFRLSLKSGRRAK